MCKLWLIHALRFASGRERPQESAHELQTSLLGTYFSSGWQYRG